ncbi:porin family protein [Aquimarina hainanensis]|uniref:Porin family protein n=1 Tax=Aquimarina hainanensis TaxID=1578017 RepID=A0ABW5NBI3_9FLAO
MKKLMFTALAVLAFTFANAQEEGFTKGSSFVSGSFGFNSESTGDVKDNSFNFSPRAAYFLTENIAAGAKLGFTSRKQENGTDPEIKTNEFTIGAFGRYYFTPATKFSVFAELELDYNTRKVEVGNGDTKFNGFGIGFAPGVNYFLNKNFAIEATWGALNYRTFKQDVSGAESTDNFNIGVNLDDINFGLVYKF